MPRAEYESEARGATGSLPEVAVGSNRAGQSIGSYLRGQRELRGIEIADLAAQTRIPVRSLERLEAGFFDGQVDGFVRGFVRTVGDGLGLDRDDTLGRMLSEPELETRTGAERANRFVWASIGVALMAVIALGALGLRQWWGPAGGTAPTGQSEKMVQRRDPVRALAEAHAAAMRGAPGSGSRAALTAPVAGLEESSAAQPKRP